MNELTLGVIKETAPGERRVALTPDGAGRLTAAGLTVLVETGAGAGAWFADEAYAQAGAEIVGAAELYRRGDVLATLGGPGPLRPGQTVIGMAVGRRDAERLAEAGATVISLDRLPRTLSAAQPMDALTSQAGIAGYRAAILAAHTYGRFFPMLVTAAGTARPARVLVLGAGVAGLQALSTARRLGAVVTGSDVRPEARQDLTSVGASFLELPSVQAAAGDGGYARALSAEEQEAEQRELTAQLARFDIVITTARVPGRRPPLLVPESAIKAMRPGSVVVDLAAGEFGGNVETARPGETVVTDNGVTVIGAENLPATMPAAASDAYSHNITAVVSHLVRDGRLVIDLDDPIQNAIVVVHEGRIR